MTRTIDPHLASAHDAPGDTSRDEAGDLVARLRGYAFTVFLALNTVILGVLMLPAAAFGPRATRRAIQVWARAALLGLGLIAGMRHRVEGREHIPTGPALVACNHQSMWETISLFALLPNPVMVFKKELLDVPVYGWWGKAGGNIVVDREAGARAIRALNREAAARLAEGAQVVIFPEGTRASVGERLAFQPGVAGIYRHADVPCVPVAHDSGRFWRHPGPERRAGVVTIRFLPPIPPGLARDEFMRRLETSVASARPDLDKRGKPSA